jgi:SAM-dependent methyltransferase
MITQILNHPAVYALWQAPFVAQKLVPFLKRKPAGFSSEMRVVELGCGPGTNAGVIGKSGYSGWDLSQAYIDSARERFPGLKFEVGDVTAGAWATMPGSVDAIFMNSLLHHLDDAQVRSVLECALRALAPGGEIHVMDLVLPNRIGLPRVLARADRGKHARLLQDWRSLFSEYFSTSDFEPYSLQLGGVKLWSMVYWRGLKHD